MKKDIHPAYKEVTVTCGCGNSFVTRSTAPKIAVEVCANCHPFFTGKQKFLDTAGMVEKFQRRWKGDAAQKAQAVATKPLPLKKGAPAPAQSGRTQKTLSAQLPGGEKASSAPAKAGAPQAKPGAPAQAKPPAAPAKPESKPSPAPPAKAAAPEGKPSAPPPQKS
ncbi:MAG TPA: 50S ribosomal protein L31 [Planctomycetota bacterium]|nr:50S ribosomal protein L31 [Planctomycetota bacterium]